jgi:hypothetical protein
MGWLSAEGGSAVDGGDSDFLADQKATSGHRIPKHAWRPKEDSNVCGQVTLPLKERLTLSKSDTIVAP